MKITIALQNAKIGNLESENAQLATKVAKMKKHITSLKKKTPIDGKTVASALEDNPLFAPSCKMQ